MIDLGHVTTEIDRMLDASSEAVWDVLADLTLTPQLNRETVETVWVAPAVGWEVGSVFRAIGWVSGNGRSSVM